jgi:predicted metal-binding membrane protein
MLIDRTIERAIKRDRVIVLLALTTVVVSSWVYVLSGAGMGMSALEMTRMSGGNIMGMMMPAEWSFEYAGVMFLMWWIMMIAMMLPSAAPMVLLFAALNRKQREKGDAYVPTALFASAYLVIWAFFSVVAVAVQWALEATNLLSPMMVSVSAFLGGSLLLAAGIYQLTPIKQACLKHCRSPLQFVLSRWRSGRHGAFRMGVEHGAYCVGCCWFLMGLLFFGGVMNLYWIAGLALFVLLEKTVPAGHWLSYATGLALMAWGVWVLVQAGAI